MIKTHTHLDRGCHVVAGLPRHPVRLAVISSLVCGLVLIIGADNTIINSDFDLTIDSCIIIIFIIIIIIIIIISDSRISALIKASRGLLAVLRLSLGPQCAGLRDGRPEAGEDAEKEQPP